MSSELILNFDGKYTSPLVLNLGGMPDPPHFLLSGNVISDGWINDVTIEILLFNKQHEIINKTKKKVGQTYEFKIFEDGEYYILYDNGCNIHILDQIHIKIEG